jgi:hypothetical protein
MNKLFATLNSRVLNVHLYSQRLQDGLVAIFRLNDDQRTSLSFVLDTILIQSLTKDQSQAIQSNAIRFAKTNWNEGPKNLFFCCFFNLRTEKVDFGNIAEDHTGLQPMDQNEWIDDQTWEVDPVLINP